MTKLEDYYLLCNVRSKYLITKYPYIDMNDYQILKTIKKIELVYKNLSHTDSKPDVKKGSGSIILITQ